MALPVDLSTVTVVQDKFFGAASGSLPTGTVLFVPQTLIISGDHAKVGVQDTVSTNIVAGAMQPVELPVSDDPDYSPGQVYLVTVTLVGGYTKVPPFYITIPNTLAGTEVQLYDLNPTPTFVQPSLFLPLSGGTISGDLQANNLTSTGSTTTATLTSGAATFSSTLSAPTAEITAKGGTLVPTTFYNVKVFGAMGDGATDDATAIQAAITACYNAGGGTVYVPNGRYRCGTPIIPRSRVRVIGDNYPGGVGRAGAQWGAILFSVGNDLITPVVTGQLTQYAEFAYLGLEATGGHVLSGSRCTRIDFLHVNFWQHSSDKAIWSALLDSNASTLFNWMTFRRCHFNVDGVSRTIPGISITSTATDMVTEPVFKECIFWNRGDGTNYDSSQPFLKFTCTGSSTNKNFLFDNCIWEYCIGGAAHFIGAAGVTIKDSTLWDMPASAQVNSSFYFGKDSAGVASSNIRIIRSGRAGDGPTNANTVYDFQFDSTCTQVVIDSPFAASTGVAPKIDLGNAQGVHLIGLPATTTLANTSTAAYVTTVKGSITAQPISGENAIIVTNRDGTTASSALKMFGASASAFLTSQRTGDTTNRFLVDVDGKMNWGSGAATRDTNLYRSAADTLKTDDALQVTGVLSPLAGMTITGSSTATVATDTYTLYSTNTNAGGNTTVPHLRFDSANSAGLLLTSRATGDASSRYANTVAGLMSWGNGTDARDTNLYRTSAGVLKTDNALTVGATFRHLGTSLGFFNAGAVSQQTVTGSRGGNAALSSLLTAMTNLGLIVNSTSA
jgi:hypothetical protein